MTSEDMDAPFIRFDLKSYSLIVLAHREGPVAAATPVADGILRGLHN